MQQEDGNYEDLEPIPSQYGFCLVLISFISLQSLRVFVRRYATPDVIAECERWRWQNIQLSWCHSTISGLGSIVCFYKYPGLSQDMVIFHNPPTFTIAAFSTGYFFSDFVDVLINFQRKNMWEILLHHIAGLALLVYNIMTCRYIGYTMAALLAEVHSISLHLRKLMQMLGVSFQNPFYRLNDVLNFVLFITFRLLAITWISLGLYWDYKRVSTQYFYLLCVTIFIIWIINIVLLWRLVKNDVLRNMNTAVPIGNGKDVCTRNSHSKVGNRDKVKTM